MGYLIEKIFISKKYNENIYLILLVSNIVLRSPNEGSTICSLEESIAFREFIS